MGDNTQPTSGDSTSILDRIFDTAGSIFGGFADIEIQKYEAKQIADLRAIEEAGALDRTQSFSSQASATGINPLYLGIGGAVLATALVVIAVRG